MTYLIFCVSVACLLWIPPVHAARKPLIHGSCTRPFPAIFNLDYALCRSAAWLKALHTAANRLPPPTTRLLHNIGGDITLGKLALAALVYPLDVVTPEKANSRDIRVFLKENDNGPERLEQILKNPWLILLQMCIIWETADAVTQLETIWPKTVENARQIMPRLESLGALLERLWLLDLSFADGRPLPPEAEMAPSVALLLASLKDVSPAPDQLTEIEKALKLCLHREVQAGPTPAAELWNALAAWTLYLRAMIHEQLGQSGLAMTDYNTALARLRQPGPLDELKAAITLGRASLHRFLGNKSAMCADYMEACTRGKCQGLAAARREGLCQGKTL